MLKYLPQLDDRQLLRLRRTLLGLATYLLFGIPLAYAEYFGWLEFGMGGLLLLIAVVILINLLFILLIVTGINRRFADPSMTLLQIAVASVMAITVIAHTEKLRGVLLMLYFSSMFFGVFRLSAREFLVLTLFAGAGYFFMMQLEYAGRPFDEKYQLEVLRFITLLLILGWLSLLGSYVSGLLTRLREKNRELENALEAITAIARQDELTQTFNRRHMLSLIRRERERVRRYGGSFALCILDIDHFKRINDTHGHLAGDQILREFVQLVEQQIRGPDFISRGGRTVDTLGRYGGEEFMLLLPETDLRGALVCAERVRRAVAEKTFRVAGGEIRLSISVGITEYRGEDSVDALIHRADEALYRAKRKGRNRVAYA